jgi:cytochrome c oxidase subunit II
MRMRKMLMLGGAAVAVLGAAGLLASSLAQSAGGEKVVKLAVKKFEYIPPTLELKKGEPVVLELTSLDRLHGFYLSALDIHADVPPNKTVSLHVNPDKVGTFEFNCDIFCGTGHEGLRGAVVVKE